MEITITLSEVESLALKYIAADPIEWLQSFALHRANIAIDEIYQLEVQRLMAEGAESIPTNKKQVVLDAFANGRVLTVVENNNKLVSEMAAGKTPAAGSALAS